MSKLKCSIDELYKIFGVLSRQFMVTPMKKTGWRLEHLGVVENLWLLLDSPENFR